MGKKLEAPKEWQQGDLTEEELKRIMDPIGEMPAPAEEPAIEVEPEPEPELEITLDDEPQTVPSQPKQAEAAPAAPDQYAHEQMVKAVVNLLRGVYRARHNGEEPDEKYVSRMRDMYAAQTDEQLQQAVDVLTKEGHALKMAA